MTVRPAPAGLVLAPRPARLAQGAGRVAVLAGGLILAVSVRVALNGAGTGAAFFAGAVFGAALILLAVGGGLAVGPPRPLGVALGISGGIALVLLPVIARSGPSLSLNGRPEPFVLWVAVTLLVAVGEEAILRGVLFDAVAARGGLPVAIAVTSVAFALLHVPLYGWHVVPLDVAVGVWLAGLRLVSRGVAAPAIAHAIADLATWWL